MTRGWQVSIAVNDQPLDLKMKLGRAGEAFFVEEAPVRPTSLAVRPVCADAGQEGTPDELATSPLTSPLTSPRGSPPRDEYVC